MADGLVNYDKFYATLKYPHRSDPSTSEYISCYDIHIGPKRTIHRRRQSVILMVPPYETWTLDTVRLVLHYLGNIVDWLEHRREGDEPTQQASVVVMPPDARGRGRRVYLTDRRVYLTVEGPKSGASLLGSLQDFTEPMRAALQSLPTEPFPLEALDSPPYARTGEPEAATAKDWRALHRVIRNLKLIAEEQPAAILAVDAVLQPIIKKLGLDDEDDDIANGVR